MAGLPELEALELWRRSLAERSERQRQSLTIEYHEIKESTAWMREAYSLGRAVAPLFLRTLPLWAGLLGRRRVIPKSTIGKVLLGWQTARSVKSLWQAFSSNGARG